MSKATDSRRFDSHEWLEAWRKTGRFPHIHDAIFNAFAANVDPGTSVLDIGASTGISTARLQHLGYTATVAEANMESIERGREYGTWGDAHIWVNYITPATIEGLEGLLKDREVKAILARRVISEVYDGMKGEPAEFARVVRESGVQIIVLEGRKISRNTVHPCGTADLEAAVFGDGWRITERVGDVRVLERVK